MQCKIMQGAKFCKVQNYARCKIRQGATFHKVQNYARYKIMHDDDDCSLLHSKACFTLEFIQWRVLSIHTDPYQALVTI